MRPMLKRINILGFLVIVAVLLAGFPNPQVKSEAEGNFTPVYAEGVLENKNWESEAGSYFGDCIADSKAATDVADAIFHNLALPQAYDEYTVLSIFYDTQDAIYIVSFGKASLQLGGGVNIALRKSDAQVLRIWFDE